MIKTNTIILLIFLGLVSLSAQDLKLNDKEYFEKRGVNFLVFSNYYNDLFDDSKISGIELIHHGVRTATNGDVRLLPTPEQWDAIPKFIRREVDKQNQKIDAWLSYPDYQFEYQISARAEKNGLTISVYLEKELPASLENKAGFNLEFLPSAYFEKSFIVDGKTGYFPIYPFSDMGKNKNGITVPFPLAEGNTFCLAPEDNERRVTINSQNRLFLYDGRNKAQNGWFVLRSLIPSGKKGKVLEWHVEANSVENWIRKPVIAHSQLGYHPEQQKIAVIELDKNDNVYGTASLLKIEDNGKIEKVYSQAIKKWGTYLRYNYFHFDFSEVKDEGIYQVQYKDVKTKTFRISKDVYQKAWYPTLDVYFPVQMDHMLVNEAYRVWHGASHLDDALQAPVNHVHFDLYAQGPTTDSPYKPGEHIPGLNTGGWYDAGDFDIRTQTQYYVINNMVHTLEDFKILRDETTINQKTRYVDIHVPDGRPDLLQQIEHGTIALVNQFRAIGHAIPGIICSSLSQYTHLGDAVNKTDNLIYSNKLDSLQSDGYRSGTFDDRWAFTSRNTSLNYGSIDALAGASRVLKGYNDSLANECLTIALKTWDEEHSHEPVIFKHGNTTGGDVIDEEIGAAVELLICTKDKKYAARIEELWEAIDKKFMFLGAKICRVLPYLSKDFNQKFEKRVLAYNEDLKKFNDENPFGVLITRGGWAGNGTIIQIAMNNYILHKSFPKIIDKEQVLKGLNYIYGTHPDSDISFVSGVGTHSKMVAYGNNRADFSFIAGGIVPGILVLKPDFPENKEDWPFLWGENEYVISVGSSYIYLVNAVNELLSKK